MKKFSKKYRSVMNVVELPDFGNNLVLMFFKGLMTNVYD